MNEFIANVQLTEKAAERAKWSAVLAKPSASAKPTNKNAWRAIVRFFKL